MMVGKRELASYRNRKLGLTKKAQQLSVLCGIDLCLLVRGPDTGTGASTLETWPPVPDRVAATIHSYRLHSTVRPAKKRRLATNTSASSVVVPDHIAKWHDLDKLSHQEFYDRLRLFSDQERTYLNGMVGSAVEALNQSIHRARHTTIDDWDSAALQELTNFMDDCEDPTVDDGADQNHVDWATSSLPPPPPPSIEWDFDSPHMAPMDELRQMLGMDDDPAPPVDGGDQHDDCMSMASSSSFPPPNSHFPAAADSAALQELTNFMDDCEDPTVDDGADQNHVDLVTSSSPPPPSIGWDFDWTHMPPMDELKQMLGMDDGADQNHVDWATSSPPPPPPPSIGSNFDWTHMPLMDELRQMLEMDDDPAAPVDGGDQHDDCMSMASSSSFPPPNSHFPAAAAWEDDARFNSSSSTASSSSGCSGGDFHFQCSLSPNVMPTQNYTADEVDAAAEFDHFLASWIAID